MTDWEIKGVELANCNCNFGCPCQFGVLPTTGNCEAAVIYEIRSGHYGDVKLDGLRAAGVYKWPGPIHEGQGHMQLIIDNKATPEQRKAVEAIMNGEDTEEMATMWFVYSAMCPNKHPTVSAPIEARFDVDARTGKGNAGDLFSMVLKPIPNIVTGDPHRIRINLPHGFEFDQAEMASGTTHTRGGAIQLSGIDQTHAHLAVLHLTGKGVVRPSVAAE